MEIDTQTNHPARHWFVPLDQLDAKAGAPLQPAELKPATDEHLAKDNDSFLVTLESLLVVKKYDRKSDNDLLVRSRLKYGNDATIEAINFFENDVPAGTVTNNLLCEYIYARDTHSTLDRVHLEVEIMELSGDISLDKTIARGLNIIKNTFGIVLSSFLPFGGVALDVMKKINNVRSQRRQIFLSQLDLYGDGGEGEARLRYGAYIFFKEPVDASDYTLYRLQVKQPHHHQPKPFPYDYVVVKIVPALIRVGSSEETALNNQKLAAVLGTLDGQMDTNIDWHPNFDQASPNIETLRKLAHFYFLKKRQASQGALTKTQNQLYQTLQQELQEFF